MDLSETFAFLAQIRANTGELVKFRIVLFSAVFVFTSTAFATIFGSVRGVIHDPQHRPIQGALVTLKSRSSEWAKNVNSDADGEFQFNAVPIGDYSISATNPGFALATQNLVVNSGSEPIVHLQMALAGIKEIVDVSGAPEIAPTDSVTPITL